MINLNNFKNQSFLVLFELFLNGSISVNCENVMIQAKKNQLKFILTVVKN